MEVVIEDQPINNDGDDYIKVVLHKIQILENRYLELKKEMNEIKRRCSKIENPKFIF
jgi:hypothetical protein